MTGTLPKRPELVVAAADVRIYSTCAPSGSSGLAISASRISGYDILPMPGGCPTTLAAKLDV